MALFPGDPVLSGDIAESRPGTDSVSAGDAVTLGNNEMAPGTDTDEFGGVARFDEPNDGRGNANLLTATVVANVADGVAEGDSLSLSPTAGELYVETDIDENPVPGPVLALSDEGGTWHSEEQTYDVPAGYAVVHY